MYKYVANGLPLLLPFSAMNGVPPYVATDLAKKNIHRIVGQFVNKT